MKKYYFRSLLVATVMIEITICGLIGFFLYNKFSLIFTRKQYVSTINSKYLIFSNHESLLHFYEPKENSFEIDKSPWMPTITAGYKINSDSLNDRYNYSIEKPRNTFRIITLGDSFTFGHYVDTENNFSERLEDSLNAQQCRDQRKFEVLNLGVRGYDIAFTVKRYQLRGVKYKPDLIIWLINPHNFLKIRDLMDEQKAQIEKDMSPEEKERARRDGNYFYTIVKKAKEKILLNYGQENVLKYQEEYIKIFYALYSGSVLMTTFEDTPIDLKQIMIKFAQEHNNSYFYDGLPALKSFDGIYPDGHPNQLGHAMISAWILNYLISNSLVPCEVNN